MSIFYFDRKQWLFLSSILFSFIYVYSGYKNAHWSSSGLASMEMANTLVSNLFFGYSFLTILFLSFMEHKTMSKGFMYACYLSTIIALFWLADAWFYGDFSLWIFKENLSPVYFLYIYIIVLGYKEKYWKVLVFILPVLIPISYLLSYNHLETLFVESSWLRRPVNSGFLTFYLIGFYGLMAYSVSCVKNKKNLIYIIILLLVSLYLAFNTWSRSWIVHVIFLTLIVAFRWIGLQKFKLKSIVYVIFAFSFIIWISLNATNNVNVISEILERVEERKNEDTRTWQYVNFFTEVETVDLIFGQGVEASYKSTNFGSNYKYIDNVFLLCMFRYGLFPLLVLIYILFKPCKFVLSKNEDIKFSCFIVCEWFLIFLGLSTYTTLNFDLATIIMMMSIGRCYALKAHNEKIITVKY